MTRRLVFLSLLLTLPVFAQSGDLSVQFVSDARMPSPERVGFYVHVRWDGEEPVRDVELKMDVPGTILYFSGFGKCTLAGNSVRCHRAEWTKEHGAGIMRVDVQVPTPGRYTATASVSSSAPDPNRENNSDTQTVEVAGLPLLRAGLLSRDDTVDPGGLGTIDLTVQNYGDAARDVVLRARIEGGTILQAEPMRWGSFEPTATCTIENGGEVTCRIAAMRAFNDFEIVRLTYRAPDRREGGKVVVTGTVQSDRPNFESGLDTFRAEVTLRRMFTVTSAEDSGAGTLRQAILESAPACEKTPCTIAFEDVTAVQPLTALPELRGMMRVTGRESRVLLDGSLLAAGDALLLGGGCGLEVVNLEIRHFPGHAIEARQAAAERSGCPYWSIGVFVRNTELAHNERGIVAKNIDASLKENFIHDQRRAGIFIDGSYYSEIFNNVVVNNGATGIYVNTSTESQYGGLPPGADIIENVVHGNGEWGIARTRNGLVQIRRNSTARNGLYGIDVGLDLSTPNRGDDSRGIPDKPVIDSATYDRATDTTVIRVSGPWGTYLDFYASTSLSRYGYPESEIYLGETYIPQGDRLELRVPGDLRGHWITATKTKTYTLYFLRDGAAAKPRADVWRPPTGRDTSELSDPVQVH